MIEAVTRERPFYLTESRSGLRMSPLSPPIDSTVKPAPRGNDDNIQQNTGIALFFVRVLYLSLRVCSEVHFNAMMQKVYSVHGGLYGMRRGSATLLILPPQGPSCIGFEFFSSQTRPSYDPTMWRRLLFNTMCPIYVIYQQYNFE